MTPEEFVIWFQGFTKAIKESTTPQLSVSQWNTILENLNSITANKKLCNCNKEKNILKG